MKITFTYNDYPSITQGYINRGTRSFESFLKKQKITFEKSESTQFFGDTDYTLSGQITDFEDLDSKWENYKETKSLYSPLQSFQLKTN